MKKKLYHQFACSSLMLPEHRARLDRHRREMVREASGEPLAPADEQQLEQYQRLAERSVRAGLPVRVTFVEGGSGRTFTGVIRERQPDPGRLRLQSGGRSLDIPITAIIRLEAAPGTEQKDR